jgi:protein phosphatase
MGTTIVVTLVSDGRLSVAHVGDSRLYVSGPRLRQLTRDDSWMVSVFAADSRADRSFTRTSPDSGMR